jgi:hypothetical protein
MMCEDVDWIRVLKASEHHVLLYTRYWVLRYVQTFSLIFCESLPLNRDLLELKLQASSSYTHINFRGR